MSDARKRANRALHNLARDPRTTRQLWQVGAGNATLHGLEREGLIFSFGSPDPSLEVWSLTRTGVEAMRERAGEATY